MKRIIAYVLSIMLIFSMLNTYSFATDFGSTEVLIDDFRISNDRSGNGWYWNKSTLNIYFGSGFSTSEISAIETAINYWGYVYYPNISYSVDFTFITDDVSYSNADIVFVKDTLSTGVLARTQLYDSQMRDQDDPNVTVGVISKSIITLSTAVSFAVSGTPTNSQYDLKSVVAHEVGHALGIAHCHEPDDDDGCAYDCSTNVMNPTLSKGTVRRTLKNYDKASLVNIYVLQHPFS